MGVRENRVEKIQAMIRASASITIQQLSTELNVSKMTIRRDLDQILGDPKIQMIRGLFIHTPLTNDNKSTYSILSAATLNRTAKERIAQKALSLLEPGDTLIMDAGSTTEMLARIIPHTLKLDITCFSLNILTEILKAKACGITLAGGKYHPSSMVFQSREAIDLLERTRVKKAFISAYGVNFRLGVTCSFDFERELKSAALNSAEQRILLVDSSKFGKVNNVHFSDLEDFDTLITDNLLPKEFAQKIRAKGITLYTV